MSKHFEPVVLKLQGCQNYLEDLLTHKLPSPTCRVSASVCLGWAPRRCTCNKAPHNTDLDRPGNHILEPLCYIIYIFAPFQPIKN